MDQSSPGLLSSVIMSVSTGLLWSGTVSQTMLTLQFCTLPPYSPFLNPIEEFFSAWRWKVYDRQPHARMPLLQAMEEACGDIDMGQSRVGYDMQGDISPVAWTGTILLVM